MIIVFHWTVYIETLLCLPQTYIPCLHICPIPLTGTSAPPKQIQLKAAHTCAHFSEYQQIMNYKVGNILAGEIENAKSQIEQTRLISKE